MTTLHPLTSPILAGFQHGFFTRQGGVSGGIYESLNVGLGSQDDPAHIAENRARVYRHLSARALITAHQTHSTDIAIIDAHTPLDISPPSAPPRADALIAKKRGIAIGVLAADCVPILLADTNSALIAAVHAGWRGAQNGIIGKVVDALCAQGGKRQTLVAAIGPAIQADAYEVGADFAAHFRDTHPQAQDLFRASPKPHHYLFDLPAFVARELARAGIATHQSALCTYARADLFFSYRRSIHQGAADYGRQIAAICLPD